jgi:hypothetical protein
MWILLRVIQVGDMSHHALKPQGLSFFEKQTILNEINFSEAHLTFGRRKIKCR